MTGVFKAITIASLVLAAPAFAGGDADKGAKVFSKCKSCHMIQDDAGNNIVKGGKTGPNLYGISGRVAGSLDGFRYGKSLKSVAESGLAWSEEQFVSYVANPKKWLQETLDDKKAKSKMSFKLTKDKDAANVWAYLVSVGPS
ncbi:MAG: c-type cytochrome [Rhodobacteraceae bacterium]|nr:c-type cytochrome [Paracoccaceae bacterium]